MHKEVPQLVKLSFLVVFALLGRWLVFTGSQQVMLIGYLIYIGVAVYLAWCVVRYFAKRR